MNECAMHSTPIVEMMKTRGTDVPADLATNGVLSDAPTIMAITAMESASVSGRESLRCNFMNVPHKSLRNSSALQEQSMRFRLAAGLANCRRIVDCCKK